MAELLKNGFDSIPQLEKNGTVHHLGIDASQIGDGCILSSNLERIEVIKDSFDDAKREAFHREYITYTGHKHGVRMSCMSIGNGCMPTEIAVEERHRLLIRINLEKSVEIFLLKKSDQIFIVLKYGAVFVFLCPAAIS